MAKREIKGVLDKLQTQSQIDKKKREALGDLDFIFVILSERELFSAAKIAIERGLASEHFVLIGTQMLTILVD